MFVLVTDYTLRKIMSANDQGIFAGTGRAHCQRQVAFFGNSVGIPKLFDILLWGLLQNITWTTAKITNTPGFNVMYSWPRDIQHLKNTPGF